MNKLKLLLILLAPLALATDGPPRVKHEFHFARLKYAVRQNSMYPSYDGQKFWGTDYSDYSGGTPMDGTLTTILKRWTDIDIGEPIQIEPSSRDIFKYPFIYAVEAEQLDLNRSEASNLREYLLRGGFWMMDDFHGTGEIEHVLREVRKVLPGAQIERLDLSHEIFHTFFDIKDVVQVPVVDDGRRCSYAVVTSHDAPDDDGCVTWEQDGYEPFVYGVRDPAGRIVILLAANTDLGDGIEWADDPDYPHRFSKFALQFFTNVIVYALTH